MGVLRKLRIAAVFAAGALAFDWCAAQQPVQGGLQLQLAREETQSSRPLFEVKLVNPTAQPITLGLGIRVGEKNYAGAFQFELADASGRKRHLVKRDPQYIAGAVGRYIVTVQGGSIFLLPHIDLLDYWSHEPGIALLALPRGQYTLSAQYTGRNPNAGFIPAPGQPPPVTLPQTFWTGIIRSNAVAFTLTKAIGDQHAR